MVIRKTCPSPELTLREAAHNMALLTEHEKDAGKKIKRDLYFGVYRSRSFIVITRSTSLLERIKRYIQWLFGSISYKQDAIDNLAARSRRHWVPANEMKAKNEQLEAAFLKKVRLTEERLQNVEQELNNQRQINASWRITNEQKETTRAFYERMHREIQNREAAKDQAVIQKQERINTFELEVDRLRHEQRSMIQRWHKEWDDAKKDAKLRVAQVEQDVLARDKTIRQLQAQIQRLQAHQQTHEAKPNSAGHPQQTNPAVAAILGSPQPRPAHQ